MGSCDGAEICKLVRIYILFPFVNIIDKNNFGLYRDDGLILLRDGNRPNMDRIRKNVIKTFKEVEFKIIIRADLKIIDFLDVTFNLTNGTYRLCKKPNDLLLYVNRSSHPQVIRHIYQQKIKQKVIKQRNFQ